MYTDPPDMPEDERMAPVELRMVREWLALGEDWIAAHLGVEIATVWAWEDGTEPIPDTVRIAVEALEAQTAEVVTHAIETRKDEPAAGLLTFLDDEQYAKHQPDEPWPSSWHRRVVMRVAQEVPGLVIVSPDQLP